MDKYKDSDGQILKVIIDSTGTVYYYNSNNQLHRLDGPAIKYLNYSYQWYKKGKLHRIGGPAYYNSANNCYSWYKDGECYNTRIASRSMDRYSRRRPLVR